MPEHVPAAVRELDRVPALRTAIGQDIDRGFPLLRPEIVCRQSFPFIAVRCPDDHFDVLHSVLLSVSFPVRFSAVYDQPSPR